MSKQAIIRVVCLGAALIWGGTRHQVLEQMGEAGLAGFLVFRANMIPEIDGHDQRHLHLRGNHAVTDGTNFTPNGAMWKLSWRGVMQTNNSLQASW